MTTQQYVFIVFTQRVNEITNDGEERENDALEVARACHGALSATAYLLALFSGDGF
jgi:hypothetical protein